jgi:hypothetical protein
MEKPMRDAPCNIAQEPTMNTMDLIDDIAIHHEIALTLVQLIGLIGSGIGYERDREVGMNVIERELHAAAASMKALTALIPDCRDEGVQP